MNKVFALLLFAFMSFTLTAQSQYHPEDYLKTIPEITTKTPLWAKKMYSLNPNVFEIDDLYRAYYKQHTFIKTTHTQNYKYWRRNIEKFVNAQGDIVLPTREEFEAKIRQVKTKRTATSRTGNWTNIGPFETYGQGTTTPKSIQANVYSMDQSELYPDFLVAGTESGGVFKSSDRGLNWRHIGWNYELSGGHTAIQVHPTDTNNILVRASNDIYQSTDGGVTWTDILYMGWNKGAYEIKFHPTQPDTIYVAGSAGLHRTYDGGANWTQVYTDDCYDITFHTSNVDTVYLLKENPTAVRAELFRSDDGGVTWTIKDNGWFTPSDPANASVSGGKIGISAADPNIIYVGLIGAGKSGDGGWIGVYRSFDKGENWTNPQGQDGSPYASVNTNPWNVAAYNDGYHQGFYNFDLIVSDIDPGKILVGTVRLSMSTDSAQSFALTHYGHADIQDMEKLGNEVWVASDGGIDYSPDDYVDENNRESRKRGIIGSNLWGFGAGWNYDILFGGKYHNGNSVYYQAYTVGDYHHINGVEEATGYVHPIDKLVYNGYGSGTQVRGVPETFGSSSASFPTLALKPNEHYVEGQSSNLIFDNRYAEWMYMGNGSQFWKSTNNGASFTALHDFGTDGMVYEMVQSRSDSDVFYAVFKPNGTSARELYRTADGGTTWTNCTAVPTNNRNKLEITINPSDENELWVVCNDGNNGNDVFSTNDGGTTWINRSTNTINDEHYVDIYYQGGTNDVVYIVGRNTLYYYDTNTSDWIEYGNGLSFDTKALQMKPFYRDGKLRLATSGRGIWEAPLAEQNFTPVAQPITHADSIFCAKDTVQFDCYSMINHTGSTWQWTFSPAPLYVSSTSARNPKVVFGADGNYTVTLQVTNNNGATDSKTITDMVKVEDFCGSDGMAGNALELTSSGDYAVANFDNEGITEFTMSAWIKPNGSQNGFAGIISNGDWCAHCDNTIGLIYDYDGEDLWFRWGDYGGNWGGSSGMKIPSDEWSYVAMTVKSDSIVLYLNDDRYVRAVGAVPAVDVANWYIGKGFYNNPYFDGNIDEVTLWNRHLSQAEIRTLRHQTKTDAMLNADVNLIGYFQFNTIYNAQVLNKKGGNHATMNGNATLVNSSAPIGNGTVERKTLSGGGEYDFATTGAKLLISDCTDSDGEMYITRIEQTPFLPANGNANTGNYWIINHYDESGTLSTLDSIELTAVDADFTTNLSQTSDAILHLRGEQSDAFDWETKSTAKTQNGNTLRFGASNNINGATQILITDGGASFTEIDAPNYCEADTLPMTAVNLDGTGAAHVIIPAMNLNTNSMTISTWIKPNGIQNSNAGIIFSRSGSTTSGINFKSNNELGYHWNGNEYNWSSGAIVPVDEWSHVVLVIEPTQATIYLNGKPYIRTGRNHVAEAFDGVTLIGRDNNSSSRVFNGDIDEVAIWKRALTQEEIRLMRHLTQDKIIGIDADLAAYYQFNETEETAFDKSANQLHASFNGNSTLTTSTAPIAGGTSQKMTIAANGNYDFNTVGFEMNLPSGTTPNGDVVVSRLHYAPTDLPTADTHLGYYWIVNNYGTNQTFTAIDNLKLKTRSGAVPTDFNDENLVSLYKADDNEHLGNQWANTCNPNVVNSNDFEFNTTCNLTSFSQFHILTEVAPLPVELLYFNAEKAENEQVKLTWESTIELDFSHYTLERSADGRNFEKIAEIQSNSTLLYEHFDNQPFNGYNYYRLKMVDLDGTFEYSDIKAVFIERKTEQNPIGIFPNPVTANGILNINLGTQNEARLRIYKTSGKLAKDFILNNDTNEVQLDGLSSGVYLYSIQTEDMIWNGQLIVVE